MISIKVHEDGRVEIWIDGTDAPTIQHLIAVARPNGTETHGRYTVHVLSAPGEAQPQHKPVSEVGL